MISTNLFLSLSSTFLSLGISACKYAPGTSAMTVDLPSYASINRVATMLSRDAVGDDIISPSFTYLRCFAPLAHVRPFIEPSLFSLIRFTASKAFIFSSEVKVSGFIGATARFPGMGPSSSCFSSLIMAATALSPNRLNPSLADIWVSTMPIAFLDSDLYC